MPDPSTPEDVYAPHAAWADYRKEYGIGSNSMTEAHKAFLAGWDAARGVLDIGGALQ